MGFRRCQRRNNNLSKNAKAPAHHHVGAEHFQFVLAGAGIALVNGKEIKVQAGDLIYNYEMKSIGLNSNSEAFSFAEFFVPGVYKTIWAKKENVCTWSPTGRNVEGSKQSACRDQTPSIR